MTLSLKLSVSIAAAGVIKVEHYSSNVNLQNNQEIKQMIFQDLARTYNLSLADTSLMLNSNSSKVQKLLNHPVHIVDEDENLLPSAFIPFCAFGGYMHIMGFREAFQNHDIQEKCFS